MQPAEDSVGAGLEVVKDGLVQLLGRFLGGEVAAIQLECSDRLFCPRLVAQERFWRPQPVL